MPQVFLKCVIPNTNFPSKLKKCCHEVTVENSYKLRVALRVTAREAITFFSRSAPFRATSHDFQRSLPGEVINWIPVPTDKNLGTTDIQSCRLKFFSTESGPYEI